MPALLSQIPSGTRLGDIGKLSRQDASGRIYTPTDSLRIRATYLVEDLTRAGSSVKMTPVLQTRTFPDEMLRIVIELLKDDETVSRSLKLALGFARHDLISAMELPDMDAEYDDIFLRPPPVVTSPTEDERQADNKPMTKDEITTEAKRWILGMLTMNGDQMGGFMTRNAIGRPVVRRMIELCRKDQPQKLHDFETALGKVIYDGICAEIK